jgi:hypothetical protein
MAKKKGKKIPIENKKEFVKVVKDDSNPGKLKFTTFDRLLYCLCFCIREFIYDFDRSIPSS